MNSGVYTAASGMRAQMDALDLLANNLANLNTAGFKEEKAFFTVMNQTLSEGGPSDASEAAAARAIQARGAINLTSGSLKATGSPLDVAIEGDGYLAVETPQGVRYTRNGNLTVNARGILTTSSGFSVLGENGVITLGPGDVRINETGEIYLSGTRVDRLKIASFGEKTQFSRQGSSLLSPEAGNTATKDAADVRVHQGYLEQSNVNPITSVVRMMEIMRHYEAIQKSIQLEMNEMNTKAIERLGR